MSLKLERFFDEQGRRVDGRAPDELRPVEVKCGVVKRANGSAYVRQGNTKVIVAVYGPRAVIPRHQELPGRALIRCQYQMLPFSTEERKQPAPTRREVEISKVVRDALKATVFTGNYPRTVIDIFIAVVNADAGTRCAAINAASVALADAGIALKDLTSSCAVGKVEGKLILDPCGVEDYYGEADVAIAIMPQSNEITLLQMDGRLTKEEFNKALNIVFEACRKIYVRQREALRERYVRIAEAVRGEERE
ncbi:TPA: exosome complex exonuclease Rrp41 [Candidatus Bathyarchaeota archaeon]|nr:exosome complex exonuclease Rrp41 [Candidatus Bathyarchaeota archaeon]